MKIQMCKSWVVLAAILALGFDGCGYNRLQTQDEQIKAGWPEVLNQYQRRADRVPNLVNTVKGYAAQEIEVLIRVTEARARVGSVQATPELISNPEALARFQSAQNELSSALSRLLVVSENYPQLKSDANFRDLQAQLEGTENRITVARNRYIKAVQDYNVTVRLFPSNLTARVFGYGVKPNFTVAAGLIALLFTLFGGGMGGSGVGGHRGGFGRGGFGGGFRGGGGGFGGGASRRW